MPGVYLRGLTKRYGDVAAVQGLDLDVRPGELLALLGPSGCGKTTTLRLVAGFLRPEAGEILVGDRVLSSATSVVPPERRRMAMIFQSYALWPHMTVAANVAYGLRWKKSLTRAERDRRVREMIGAAGLDGFGDAFPLALSGGMRQRVALMRTLITQPQILLMDEPFGALDTHTKLEMHRILLDIWDREKQTVLFVTHDLAEALTLSDRIVVLSARPGRVKEIFEVNLPRPRDAVALRESRDFAEAFSRIWHSLGEEFRKGHVE